MVLELRVEETAEEYTPNVAGNRLEVYESLLLDASSALWRELLYRKERRSATASAASAAASATSAANGTANGAAGGDKAEASGAAETEAETGSTVFDIDSEEEKPLPVKDPSRDVRAARACDA